MMIPAIISYVSSTVLSGLIIGCFLPSVLRAQLPEDDLGDGEIDIPYLEHLVKTGVDRVRIAQGLSILVNDSILYLAAGHHADYMREKNSISHFEPEAPDKKTPQLRADFFGAVNYSVGENVLKTKYNKSVKSKSGAIFENYTYGVLAASIVDGWVNSPRHYKNMITPKYQLTGVAIKINADIKTVYAVQKFARKAYQYTFLENKRMFPHSEYEPPDPVTSFDGIPSQLIEKEHAWELTHPLEGACDSCRKVAQNPPEITLRRVKRNFMLRIENSEYVKRLLHKKKDGFAVELVVFDDYMCGNPAYYTKASRRNGQCNLNGTVLEPIYRNDLLKGFKRRKRRESLKFVSYIFNNDTIPFWQRFWRFKLDKYSSQYFQIRLGRLPRDFEGYFEHNLLYIQDEQACHVDYFSGLCGTTLEDEREMFEFTPDTFASFTFPLDTKVLEFTIPFEKNKTHFSEDDIMSYTSKLTDLSFVVDSLFIDAYSSVEGDSVKNQNLQLKRAASMVDALQQQQISSITMEIETFDSWEDLYGRLKMSPKWRFLARYPKKRLQELINKTYADSLEFILKTQRRADVTLKVSIPVNDANRTYYIDKTWKEYMAKLRLRSMDDMEKFKYLRKIDNLYKYTFKYVMKGLIDTAFLAGLPMPVPYRDWSLLQEKFLWYGQFLSPAYDNIRLWQDNMKNEYEKLIDDFLRQRKGLSPKFVFNYCKATYETESRDSTASLQTWERLFDLAEKLKSLYVSSPEAERNLKNLVFNLHLTLLNKGYYDDPFEHRENALKSLQYVIAFYRDEGGTSPEKALALAKLCSYYQARNLAFAVLDPFVSGETVYPDHLAYYTVLIYRSPADDPTGKYYSSLLKLPAILGEDRWCNMFLGSCGIPFQAFDHEALRDRFCETCPDKNKFLMDLLR